VEVFERHEKHDYICSQWLREKQTPIRANPHQSGSTVN